MWEYKFLVVGEIEIERLEDILNGLGEKGWELASVVSKNYIDPNPAYSHTYIFKKPKK